MLDALKGFKTFLVAGLAGLLALGEVTEITDLLSPEAYVYLAPFLAVVMIFMRFLTSSPPGSSS